MTYTTSTNPESSLNDYSNTNIGPFISGGIIGVFVLLASMIVLVVIVLFMKRRYIIMIMCTYSYNVRNKTTFLLSFRIQRKPLKQTYAIVDDLGNKNPIENSDPPESKINSLALKSTIEDIHNRSENEKDTPNITSMKNVLYESGKRKFNLLS